MRTYVKKKKNDLLHGWLDVIFSFAKSASLENMRLRVWISVEYNVCYSLRLFLPIIYGGKNLKDCSVQASKFKDEQVETGEPNPIRA